MQITKNQKLAIFGGQKTITQSYDDIFYWPVFSEEEEQAVLNIMRKPNFHDEVTVDAFQKEFAQWCGTKFAVTNSCGTNAVLEAMFACGVGVGDEVIAPSCTYWATVLQCFHLGATMIFADIDNQTMCISANDIERKISDKTKAIIVVHFLGYPVDMDAVNEIAKRHSIKVIEDASLYKGRKAGTLADVAAFSLCGKPISVGEGGILVTNDRTIYERAIAWGHNFRFCEENVKDPELLKFKGLPLGGVTSRMHNLSAAIGRVQLRHYDDRMEQIDKAMNYFLDLIDDLPGITTHRPPKGSGSKMGGWYCPHAIYHPEELGGLSVSRFIEGVCAEGFQSSTRGCIKEPLHLHPLLNDCDVYGHGKPTRLAFCDKDVRQGPGSLPVSESIKSFKLPPFKKFVPEVIELYASLFKKVVDNHKQLIEGDRGDAAVILNSCGDG